jgi:hypothetical protein
MRPELIEGRRTQELQRAAHLRRQDPERAIHACATAGHEPVHVRAPDEHIASAQRHCRHDVGPRHDARVEPDLHVGANLAHDFGQQVERHGGAVELTPTVVREHDAVHPRRGDAPRVVE